ncbi:hypothetical protein ACQPZF_23205 [Actinosynnema sp. CS-041913]|uniref:hypothetical protein n=1 Tax=Actinosynnema sp. CS-041913 TaxID=3239917 RepID=UPI003D909CF6
MTTDFIALCRQRPDREHIAAALHAACPSLAAGPVAHGALLRIYDEAARPLVAVEGPLLVQVAGEPLRLLGIAVEVPVWWIEARAELSDERATLVARRFIAELAAGSDGVVWP